jgi:hypothetical protein
VSGHPHARKYSVHFSVAGRERERERERVLITNNYIAAASVSYSGLVMDKENKGLHRCTVHFFISPEI